MLTIPNDLSPGKDNGLLQVWEIFESVRLDTDLVVLSGCETALGRELSGEGLIGLTRAFQYAGARSVVASLWSVTDQVTAANEQTVETDASAPFFWAAFQVFGDWL